MTSVTKSNVLYWAAFYNQADLARFLIREQYFDLITTNRDGFTPLGIAARARSVRAVKRLCQFHTDRRVPLVAYRSRTSLYNKHSVPQWLLSRPSSILTGFQHSATGMRKGFAERPFSPTSLATLQTVLEHGTDRVSLGTNLCRVIRSRERMAGVD